MFHLFQVLMFISKHFDLSKKLKINGLFENQSFSITQCFLNIMNLLINSMVNLVACLLMRCCYLNEATRSRNGVLSGFIYVSC